MDSRFRGNDDLKTAVGACGLSSPAVNLNLSYTLFRPGSPVFCAVNARMSRHLMQLTGESVCRAEPRCEGGTAAGQGKGRSWRARRASGRIGAPAVFHVVAVPGSAGRPVSRCDAG